MASLKAGLYDLFTHFMSTKYNASDIFRQAGKINNQYADEVNPCNEKI